jgi:AcrR family transcriptional regulator
MQDTFPSLQRGKERVSGSKEKRTYAMISPAREKPRPHGRDGILQAALQLFSRRGYDATSIDDIRQAAGFKSKASLYTHFKSKEEIASALLQEILEQEDQVVMQAYHLAEPEPLHQFLSLGKAFITWSLSHPQEASFCFLRVQQEALIQGKLASIKRTDPRTTTPGIALRGLVALGKYPLPYGS